MDYVLATLCGIIVIVMNVFNGQLSDYTGVYLSTVIIHLVGLITFFIIMKIKNKKVCFKKQIPLYMYCGGCIGVLTVIFNVFAIGKIGASLMTALGLLGQMMTSLLLENKGWLSTSIRKLNKGKIICQRHIRMFWFNAYTVQLRNGLHRFYDYAIKRNC